MLLLLDLYLKLPPRLWPTDASTRSWTASWPPASRSSPPPSTAPHLAAVIMASRPTTTAGNNLSPLHASLQASAHNPPSAPSPLLLLLLLLLLILLFLLLLHLTLLLILLPPPGSVNMQCWVCPRWKPTSTGISTSRGAGGGEECGAQPSPATCAAQPRNESSPESEATLKLNDIATQPGWSETGPNIFKYSAQEMTKSSVQYSYCTHKEYIWIWLALLYISVISIPVASIKFSQVF